MIGIDILEVQTAYGRKADAEGWDFFPDFHVMRFCRFAYINMKHDPPGQKYGMHFVITHETAIDRPDEADFIWEEAKRKWQEFVDRHDGDIARFVP